MALRLVVFDLDGTLVDSRRDLADSVNALLTESGADGLSESVVGDMVGEGAPILVQRALAAAGLALDPAQALRRFLAIYEERLLDHTRPYPGLASTLEEASRLGLSLAVLTNKPWRATEQILRGLRLAHFFASIVGGDGPFPKKPDPAGLSHLVAGAGATPAEALLVGDSSIDRETAARAGVRFCLARYGFGYRAGQVLKDGDLVIDAVSELVAVITALRGS